MSYLMALGCKSRFGLPLAPHLCVRLKARRLNIIATTTLLVATFVVLCVAPAFADSYTFASLPGPGVSHTTPGSTAGWGYSITNNSANNWLVVTGLTAGNFPGATVNPFFFDFPSIAPGTSRIVPYNPFSPYGASFLAANGFAHPVLNLPFDPVTNPFNALGLYQITIDPNTPVGTVFSGNFGISAVWFNGDPDTNLSAQFVSFAANSSAPYTVTVTPEPASLTLVGTGIVGLALGVRKKKKSQTLS